MIFVTDECISPRLARMLDAFDMENEVRALTDFVDAGTPDEEWLKELASWKPKPAVLSGDKRILRNDAQRKVLRESNLSFIYPPKSWMNTPWNEQAWKYVRVWPDVVRNVSTARKPTLFELRIKAPKVHRVGLITEL